MSAISYLRLLQDSPAPAPAEEGGWDFTDYDSALKLCVAALVRCLLHSLLFLPADVGWLQAIKIVLVTLLTVRTRIKGAGMRTTPEGTAIAEDDNAVVGFLIFIVMKPLLLAGMPGMPDKPTAEETEPVRCLLSPASVLC